ncbi:hypothetical protein AXW67_18220 [Bradyrhizobium neotropicale]|uniref:Uncharacterized protein n=1 Tax=Bradyrhizobium neotropicale TaxID=1497615 RepID=A0A176Z1R0_9BRAD|nr:hypothetical protein AXW67_18220 [Bradyrhizobium neotropicale]
MADGEPPEAASMAGRVSVRPEGFHHREVLFIAGSIHLRRWFKSEPPKAAGAEGASWSEATERSEGDREFRCHAS